MKRDALLEDSGDWLSTLIKYGKRKRESLAGKYKHAGEVSIDE
ncbi:MAG: hypothetical protein ACYSR0_10355 [Planctomycetota bacterium]|jgi:hypothetical protein